MSLRGWLVSGVSVCLVGSIARAQPPPPPPTTPPTTPTTTPTEPPPTAPPTSPPPAPTPTPTTTPPSPSEATTITPYGVMVLDGWYNTGAMQNADVPLTATTPAANNESSIGATARQSRFGVKIQTPSVATAIKAKTVEGVFEIDFFGGYYPTNNNSFVNQLLPRLRLFNVAVSFDRVKIVAGQDWMLFAPVNPDSIHHMELPALSNTGNLWSRFPQVSAHLEAGPIKIALGVLAPADSTPTGMAPVAVVRDPGAADKSLAPSLQGRVSYAAKASTATFAVGASGHFGREKVAGDPMAMIAAHKVASWGTAADVVVTVGKVLVLKGEAFVGANLDGMFSGAAIAGPDGMQEPTPVRGYWAQVGVKQDKLGFFAAYGAENPDEPDSSHPLPANAIHRNYAVNVAATWTFAPKLVAGVEVDYVATRRVGLAEQSETHIAVTGQYGF